MKKLSVRDQNIGKRQEIVNQLEILGYEIKKKNDRYTNAKQIIILTDEHRPTLLKQIEKQTGFPHDKNLRGSSIGGLVASNEYSILVKLKNAQGKLSAGIKNETTLLSILNRVLDKHGPINVVFSTKTSQFRVNACIKAILPPPEYTQSHDKPKADILLIDSNNNQYPFSIKKEDAENWESADNYYREKGRLLIREAVEKELVTIIPMGDPNATVPYFKLSRNIARLATKAESIDMVFGTDINPNGAVIIHTFNGNYSIKDSELIINVTAILKSIHDLRQQDEVYFIIRSDKGRNSFMEYKGLRPLAVSKRRVKNCVIL
jgi:hypothetical protein